MLATIYHNPRCGTSRKVLKLLESKGQKPMIVDYMKNPPSIAELKGILRLLGCPAHQLLRQKEKECAALGLDENSAEDTIIAALSKNPSLMQHPIVLSPRGARIARPPETALEIV